MILKLSRYLNQATLPQKLDFTLVLLSIVLQCKLSTQSLTVLLEYISEGYNKLLGEYKEAKKVETFFNKIYKHQKCNYLELSSS